MFTNIMSSVCFSIMCMLISGMSLFQRQTIFHIKIKRKEKKTEKLMPFEQRIIFVFVFFMWHLWLHHINKQCKICYIENYKIILHTELIECFIFKIYASISFEIFNVIFMKFIELNWCNAKKHIQLILCSHSLYTPKFFYHVIITLSVHDFNAYLMGEGVFIWFIF